MTIDASGERKWTRDVLSLRFTGVYQISRDRDDTPSKSSTDQDSQRLLGRWKRTVRSRFFWETASELSRDSTQDLEARARVAAGLGYRVFQGEDADSRHSDVSAGPGYRYELYAGDKGDQHLADLIARFDYKNQFFDDRIEWQLTGSAAAPANQPEAFLIRTEVIIGVPLTGAWSFRTSVLYEYVGDAPDGVSPSTMRTSVGLSYEF